ncbi:hypothetical protein, partial [Streptomyces mirabilis]|uniref:hypothetical protein n=1 Tax=Streptomyces mirabilis TaxID=68239 RepID=UPI0036955AF6
LIGPYLGSPLAGLEGVNTVGDTPRVAAAVPPPTQRFGTAATDSPGALLCTVADAIEASRIAEACTLSLHEHRPVRLDEVRK